MSTLTNRTIKSTYGQLLQVENNTIQDGFGTSSISASLNLTGAIDMSGSTSLIGTSSLTGSQQISGTLEILGTASISHLITTYESSSIIYASGSTKFGDDTSDTHERTGSMTISGSLFSTNISGTFSGSYKGDGSGLTGLVTSSHAVTASHAISSSYAVSSSEATTATNVHALPSNTSGDTHYVIIANSTTGITRARTDNSLTYVPSTNTLTATTFAGNLTGNASTADTASVVLGTILSASFAVTASHAESQSVQNITSNSFAASGDGPFTGSFSSSLVSFLSGSFTGSATGSFIGNGAGLVGVVTSSFAITASHALNGGGGSGTGFPLTGSAPISGTLLVTGSNTPAVRVSGSTTLTGSLQVSGSTSVTGGLSATSITETSALRYKENIVTLDSSDVIYNLRPVTFDWKDTGQKDFGLIAEEVNEHLPELVEKSNVTGEVEGIKYTKLTSLLIRTVQQQQEQIDDLTTRINSLENNN